MRFQAASANCRSLIWPISKQKTHKYLRNKKTLSLIFGVLAIVFILYRVQKNTKENIVIELNQTVEELNKITPLKVDEFTRLDSVSSFKRKSLTYYYTLLQVSKSEVNIDSIKNYLKPNIIKSVKNSNELKVYKTNNISMNYIYYDLNGEFMIAIEVTPELYKN